MWCSQGKKKAPRLMFRPCPALAEGGGCAVERHWGELASYASLWEASGWGQHRDRIGVRDTGGESTPAKVRRWKWGPSGVIGSGNTDGSRRSCSGQDEGGCLSGGEDRQEFQKSEQTLEPSTSQTQKVDGSCQGLGLERGKGCCCLMASEFQFRKMERTLPGAAQLCKRENSAKLSP